MKNVTISRFYTFVRITQFGDCLETSRNADTVKQRHIPHERNSEITALRKHRNSKGSSCLL